MLIKSLSDDWKWWIWNYWKLNSHNKNNLFKILLNHGIDYETIAKELNFNPTDPEILSRKEMQKGFEKEKKVDLPPLHKALADNPRVRRIEDINIELYVCDGFLQDAECDALIEKMQVNLTPSTVTNPEADKSVRTSWTSFLRVTDSYIADFNAKLHEFMRIPISHGEEPQGQRYKVGQEFKQHCDWFDVNSIYNKIHLNMGQRTFTLMIYLNDVEEGGETRFTRLDLAIKPQKGRAVIWNNQVADGSGNWYSEHWGMPVIKGEKNIVTKWFREHDGKGKENGN